MISLVTGKVLLWCSEEGVLSFISPLSNLKCSDFIIRVLWRNHWSGASLVPVDKNLCANAGNRGSIPGPEDSTCGVDKLRPRSQHRTHVPQLLMPGCLEPASREKPQQGEARAPQ